MWSHIVCVSDQGNENYNIIFFLWVGLERKYDKEQALIKFYMGEVQI